MPSLMTACAAARPSPSVLPVMKMRAITDRSRRTAANLDMDRHLVI
jgi:hypothetical protein